MTSQYATAEYDTLSQTSGAYIGKHGKRPGRVSSAHSKTLKLQGSAKTYYPNGYYKRVGYQKSECSAGSRVDALGQRVRDRFNEDLEDNPVAKRESGGIHHRTLKQLKQAHEIGEGPGSIASSKARSIFSRGNPMGKRRHTAHDKAKEEDLNDRESIIT